MPMKYGHKSEITNEFIYHYNHIMDILSIHKYMKDKLVKKLIKNPNVYFNI